MITNPRTGNDKTEYERCVQCDAIPAHECFWLVEKGADEYRLRVTVCEKHERECAEHMEELKACLIPKTPTALRLRPHRSRSRSPRAGSSEDRGGDSPSTTGAPDAPSAARITEKTPSR